MKTIAVLMSAFSFFSTGLFAQQAPRGAQECTTYYSRVPALVFDNIATGKTIWIGVEPLDGLDPYTWHTTTVKKIKKLNDCKYCYEIQAEYQSNGKTIPVLIETFKKTGKNADFMANAKYKNNQGSWSSLQSDLYCRNFR